MFDYENMTAQEVFDESCYYLASMREKSTIWRTQKGKLMKESCAYRTPSGNRCVVGYFIPDGIYTKNIETKPVDRIVIPLSRRDAKIGAFFKRYLQLFEYLQRIHDDGTFEGGRFSGWVRMRHLAKYFNLSTAIIDEIEQRESPIRPEEPTFEESPIKVLETA